MSARLPANLANYKKAVAHLVAGKLVVLPTETVYGLAALASDEAAVAEVYKIKNRPWDNPLSIVVFDAEHAHRLARISPLAQRLIADFWPGPLTLVVPKRPDAPICKLVSAGRDTVALRLPDIAWTNAFLSLGFEGPLVLTSANISGAESPANALQVEESLGGKIPLILDGGHTMSGIDSAIISIDGNKAQLLRKGALAPEDFAAYDINWTSP